jgi:hypothetical protein
MPKHVSISAICTATESRSTDESEHFNTSALDGIGALGVEGGRGVGELAWGAGCLGLPDGGDVGSARCGSVPERARLGSAILRAGERGSARLDLGSRAGSARLASHILVFTVALFSELTLYKFKI